MTTKSMRERVDEIRSDIERRRALLAQAEDARIRRMARLIAEELRSISDDEAPVSTDDGVRHDLDDVAHEFGVTE